MKSFVNVLCFWLVFLGVAGVLYWIYYNWVVNKFGLPPGLQFFLGLLVAITVGFATTYVGIYFSEQSSQESTKEIQEALYPNNFSVGLHSDAAITNEAGVRNSLCIDCGPQPLSEKDAEPVRVQHQDMRLRVRIQNNSKYPVSNFVTYLYLREENFNQDIKHIKDHIGKIPAFRQTLMDSDPLTLNVGGETTQLKGCAFLFPHIEGGDHSFIRWFTLTLRNRAGYFAVRVRDNCFLFKITHEKAPQKNAQEKLPDKGKEYTTGQINEKPSGTTPTAK